jgi:hypothetical protein
MLGYMSDAPFWVVASIGFTHHVPDPYEGAEVMRKHVNVTTDRITIDGGELVFWRGGLAVYRCAIADVTSIDLPEGSNGPVRGTHEYVAAVREEHKNAYQPWTDAEEVRLRELFDRGVPIAAIAEELGRRPGGIRSRLMKLGLYEPPAES